MDVNGTSPQPALDENDSTNTSEDDFWALTETDNQFGPKWSGKWTSLINIEIHLPFLNWMVQNSLLYELPTTWSHAYWW